MLNSQIHHQKCQEPLKKHQAIYQNSVCNRILVCHIGIAIYYLFIYLFSDQICNQHLQKPTITKYQVGKSEVKNDVRVCFKGILKYHESISAQ